MNITKLFPLAFAAIMMSACATEETPEKNNGDGGQTRYLAVNLESVGSAGTRAASGEYEDGLASESHIDNVRFYFFNSDGSPYILSNNRNRNWIEPTMSDGTKPGGENITQRTEAVLVIESEDGNVAPASVVAVVNARSLSNTGTTPLGDDAKSLDDVTTSTIDSRFFLTDATGSEATTNYGKAAKAKNFVMTNSVYDQAGARACQAYISGYVKASAEEALANPVDIYVERVVAKVTADIDTESGWTLGAGGIDGKYGKVVGKLQNGTEVYAVVEGWNVADENGTAQLEKQIDPKWTNANLGFANSNPWTSSDYHRSFWSKSTEINADNQNVNYSYKQIANNNFGSCVYTLPNTVQDAAQFSDKYSNTLTKFIVAARLRYKDSEGQWQDAEVCEYKGIQYLGCASVLNVIGQESNVWVKKTEEGATTYTQLSSADMLFVGAPDMTTGDYKAIATIYDMTRTDLVTKNSDGTYSPISATDANNIVKSTNAEVRYKGMAYYYTPIRHLGTDPTKPAYYGIVRNHVYKITLQDISGFGSPVADPTRVISPEVPSNEATYVAARINVLSWRVVNQNVDLDSGTNQHK